MIYLANENISQISIELLRLKGFSILIIKENNRGISDRIVLQITKDHNAIILTFDKDYGEILFRENWFPAPSIVFRKLYELSESNFQLNGFFTVIEEFGLRQRKIS